MGTVIIAVLGDIVVVVAVVLLWRLVGDRVRRFFDHRPPTFHRR